jgi:acetyl-CoA acetyltransferase
MTELWKTETYPLWVTTINKATVEGTIKVFINAYKQVKCDPATMQNLAVPSINDQLTNA